MAVTFAYKCATCGTEADGKSDEPIPACPNSLEASPTEVHEMRKQFRIGGAFTRW